jgi:hypothetical protein
MPESPSMVMFMRGGSQWREQLVAALPGAIVGLSLALALRHTSLTPPLRVLGSMVPMMFLLALLNPFQRSAPIAQRVLRSAGIAVLFGSSLCAMLLLA